MSEGDVLRRLDTIETDNHELRRQNDHLATLNNVLAGKLAELEHVLGEQRLITRAFENVLLQMVRDLFLTRRMVVDCAEATFTPEEVDDLRRGLAPEEGVQGD